jgi:ribonuclease HII
MYNEHMNFKLEKKLRKQGYSAIIGVDEVGRGPLAGPVVACAATVQNDKFLISNFQPKLKFKNLNNKDWNLIKDSKKLSAKQREGALDFIQKNFYVGVGMCDHKTIDRINILQASLLAMKKAIANLIRNKSKVKSPKSKAKEKIIVLVDGNRIIPGLKNKQSAIIKGDDKVFSIAAASIIAKVTRDRLMQKWHKKYPQYEFAKHKGYGTKLHMERLKKYGPSLIHRLSFQPVREAASLPKCVFDVKFRKEK